MSIINKQILTTEQIKNSILDSICHELCFRDQSFYGLLRHMDWEDNTLYISGNHRGYKCYIGEPLLNLLSKYQINTIKFEYTQEDFKNELTIEIELVPKGMVGDYGVTLINGFTIQSDRKILINLF